MNLIVIEFGVGLLHMEDTRTSNYGNRRYWTSQNE